jgi:hypothetical protein
MPSMPMRILAIATAAGLLSACSMLGLGDDSASTTSAATPVVDPNVQLGVNGYLWRATLDTLAFMPLVSADARGGVIVTDWYSAPETPNERLKVTAYILDKTLRADGIRVSVFRQNRAANGWADAAVNPATPTQLENAILARARQLRLATVAQ